MSPQEIVAAVLLLVGLLFVVVAAVGFVRLPDVYCRLHVTGIMDTLGVPMMVLGAAVYLGASLVSLKLLLGLVFLVFTSPLLGHLLARAALEDGFHPQHLDVESDPVRAGGDGP